MHAHSATPRPEVAVDATLISQLLRSQHPDLAHLTLSERYEGWDNVTWRLGTDLAVRVPRRLEGAKLTATEHSWLPALAPHLPCAVPVPVRLGTPQQQFPWPWSVVRWIEGTRAYESPLNDQGLSELGQALRALHQPASDQAPKNVHRSQSLLNRMTLFEDRLDSVRRDASARGVALDTRLAHRVYMDAAVARRPRLTWTHLDVHGNNVLTNRGRLAGIVDWGDAGAGDPATDLGQAMALAGLNGWAALFTGYGVPDAATFTRARAEALTYATTLAHTREEPYASHGWRALYDLGFATRVHTSTPTSARAPSRATAPVPPHSPTPATAPSPAPVAARDAAPV